MIFSRQFLLVTWATVTSMMFGTSALASGITNPNQFTGNDTERIQAAIRVAAETHSNKIVIPAENSNGKNYWLIDSAILLPSDMTVILENCTLRMSNTSRDNMFRSDNVGEGIESPQWNRNINLVGIGQVLLKGAENPRSTGDAAREQTLDPAFEMEKGNWRVSYGSDAGKIGEKHTGDWRNILILIAYVDGFTMRNLAVEDTHSWAISFERTINAQIDDIRLNNRDELEIDGRKVAVSNKDGINLRQGCKYFRINNITGYTGDDFIALSNLGSGPDNPAKSGDITSHMVTAATWFGPEDDIEHVSISNIHCANRYRAVAIRATDQKGIHHVHIDGLNYTAIDGKHEAILLGGQGYGPPSLPGKINNIYAMNINGSGLCLVRVEAPVTDCAILNGIYTGDGEEAIWYTIDKHVVSNLQIDNIVHRKSSKN